MIQLRTNGLKVGDGAQLQRLRDEFEATQCVFLPAFLDPIALGSLLRRVDAASFVPKLELDEEEEFGKILFVPPTDPAVFIFDSLLNNPELFNVVETITGCGQIGNFFGRIHRSLPSSNHRIDWHGDNADYRLLGMTMNLSQTRYTGGIFQLRERTSERIVRKIRPEQLGDTFIFQISPDLQHRLTLLESGAERTVGVGWFRSQPDWKSFSKAFFRSF
jgi:hypothetical protein